MADLETQIRSLADRRFEATEPVAINADETQGARATGLPTANERRIDGTEMIDMHPNETTVPQRRRYALIAAAVVVAIAGVGIALVASNDEPAPPAATPAPDTLPPVVTEATTPPTTVPPTLPPPGPVQVELTGAEGNAEAAEAFTVVVDAYEAFNDGDAMGWATARGPGEPPPEPELQYVEAARAAGARYEVTSCDYDGFGESRGELRGVDGHRFTCRTKMIDQFTVAAGLDFDEVFTWTVADGAVLDAMSTFRDLNNLQLFMRLLDAWVESEHPGIAFTAIEWWAYPLASEVPGVLGVVDEFVASNDLYPLTGG